MILMADDDADDRQMTQEAMAEARLVNELRFVVDGEDLMDYLHRRGAYADGGIEAPTPGIILLDLNMPKKDGREALEEIKADPEPAPDPGRRADDLAGRGGRLSHLRPRGQLLHHQAGDVRRPRRGDADLLPLLVRDRRPPAAWPDLTPPAPERLAILLVEDDEDDFVLTRDLLAGQSRTRFDLEWISELRGCAARDRGAPP